jgi:tryptophan halogenase
MTGPLRHLAVVGGGTAGWLAAAMIFAARNRRNDGPDLRITLVESPSIPTVGVGEATTLSMGQTLALLGIDEKDFVKHCDASLKSSVKFVGWDTNPDGSPASYYHPFESPPYVYGYAPAYHYHRRARQGRPQPPFTHAMGAPPWICDANKAPKRLGDPDYQGLVPYAYHMNASLLAEYLRDYCTNLGVEHVRDDVVDVSLDERGFATELNLAARGAIPVDFVVDCSGFRGLIIRKAFGEPFIGYERNLPCDRAIAAPVPHRPGAALPPFTTSTALGAGWSWDVPLWSRRGRGYVYSSRFASDDAALREFLDFLAPDQPTAEPILIRMQIGRSRRSWVNNCLAVGLAGGFIEPLESTSIHFVQMSIRWFLDNFPDRNCAEPLRAAYNRQVEALYEELRDFIAMHYRLSNRDDTPFWRAARRELELPDRLAANLELWRHKLPSALECPSRLSMFSEWSFIFVLYGKRFFDDAEFPIETAISDADYDDFAATVARERERALAQAPDHWALLSRMRADAADPWYRPQPLRPSDAPTAALL